MTRTARNILEQALLLSPDERAILVAELIASMDGEPDADAERAWAAEIERRARRVLAGETAGRDWESIRTELRERYRSK